MPRLQGLAGEYERPENPQPVVLRDLLTFGAHDADRRRGARRGLSLGFERNEESKGEQEQESFHTAHLPPKQHSALRRYAPAEAETDIDADLLATLIPLRDQCSGTVARDDSTSSL
jgi:hypothetical protein